MRKYLLEESPRLQKWYSYFSNSWKILCWGLDLLISGRKMGQKNQKFFFQTWNLPRRGSFQDIRTQKKFTNYHTDPHVTHRLTHDFSKIQKFHFHQILTKFLYKLYIFHQSSSTTPKNEINFQNAPSNRLYIFCGVSKDVFLFQKKMSGPETLGLNF